MKEQDNPSLLDILKERISYKTNIFTDETTYGKVLNNLLEDSKFIALSLKYPFDDTKEELPNTSKYNNWQIRCALELYNLLKSGGNDFVSYSENGISWTRDSSIISKQLKSEIMPKVGIPKKSEVEDV